MGRYEVGFDGRWQGAFRELRVAEMWAEEVALTGRVVDVVRVDFGFRRFVTAFPRSAIERRRAFYYVPPGIASPGG